MSPKKQDETDQETTGQEVAASEKQDNAIVSGDMQDQTLPIETKYTLLDRLFKFVQINEDEELNSVLCSYFCKLVAILIRRNPTELTQYIFAPNSNIIESLLKHSYQKSISDLLLWVLVRIGNSPDPEMLSTIQTAQKFAISKLVLALGPSFSDEHNLNAQALL